ncbi:MAG: SDR family oxidoreductase [Spirochaetaceae bacterium]|nr:MAG: SDR family oxidoreductase [Spirochaetaceae bacterium]
MTVDLRGQTALVTGAGRGIGRAISASLAAAGARVYLAARTAEQLQSVAEQISRSGGNSVPIPTDLASEEQIQALFGKIHSQEAGLDILINNAGVGIYGPAVDFTSTDFDTVMRVNAKAAFLCCQQALKLMIPKKRGYIINISSVLGFKGYANQAAYTASKHALVGLTKSLAAEVQEQGIRVSVILPGGVNTRMIADARPDLDPEILLQPEDIAHTVMFLLSLSDLAAVDQIYIRRRSSKPF